MIAKDKILHFSISAVLVIVGMLGFYFLHLPGISLATPALVFVIGISKELYDRFIKRTEFSIPDLFADAAGIIAGAIIAGVVVLMIQD